MSDIAISASGLGKRYRIGPLARQVTLGERLTQDVARFSHDRGSLLFDLKQDGVRLAPRAALRSRPRSSG